LRSKPIPCRRRRTDVTSPSGTLQRLDEVLKEEFKKEEEKKDDVGKHYNETVTSEEVGAPSAQASVSWHPKPVCVCKTSSLASCGDLCCNCCTVTALWAASYGAHTLFSELCPFDGL
jgi:hypothetical protein